MHTYSTYYGMYSIWWTPYPDPEPQIQGLAMVDGIADNG